MLADIGVFDVPKARQVEWRTGQLVKEWAAKYPQLFDEQDSKMALVRCGQGRHFFEWLSAIILHHATGYRARSEVRVPESLAEEGGHAVPLR